MDSGFKKKTVFQKLRLAREPRFVEGSCPSLTLYWEIGNDGNAAVEQVITLCSIVYVILSATPEPMKFQAS